MALELAGTATPAPDPTSHAAAEQRIRGLRCRGCGTPDALGPSYVCAACFGPLEVDYDLDLIGRQVAREDVARRAPGIWRYLELLPVDAAPERGLAVGARRWYGQAGFGAALGVDGLLVRTTPATRRLVQGPGGGDRRGPGAVVRARGARLREHRQPCAPPPPRPRANGLPPIVFVPADIESGKIASAAAYGATVVRVRGPYDAVNRLCGRLADELPRGQVNLNLRPFYAEGSKTLGFEIAEDLGWRLPDVVVAPVASGAMLTRLARAFEELVTLGWVDRKPVRFVGGQAAGCAPIAAAFAAGRADIDPVRNPVTIVRSLAIGSPADGRDAVALARASSGSIEAVTDDQTADAIRRTATLEGIYAETAGGVTIAAVEAARRRGTIRPGDEVVALLTGNGLKTPDAVRFGVEPRPAAPGRPGLTPVIPARFGAFERWLAVA
jgi:threonine synthase